jgi:hypothetical protein
MTTLRIMFNLLALVLVTAAVKAQTHCNNDPGVSVHNYKHQSELWFLTVRPKNWLKAKKRQLRSMIDQNAKSGCVV